MSLAMIGEGASYEFRWRRWALLRDTLLYLERPPGRFPNFSAIGDALVTGSLRLPAAALGDELDAISKLLRGHTIEEIAISPTTASVLYMGARLEAPRPLTAHERGQIAPPGAEADLADFFGTMVESLREVCTHPLTDGRVEIVDG